MQSAQTFWLSPMDHLEAISSCKLASLEISCKKQQPATGKLKYIAEMKSSYWE